MMAEHEMEYLYRVLRSRGYTHEKAEEYAIAIGDTPEEAPDGRWIIRNPAGEQIDTIDPIQ